MTYTHASVKESIIATLQFLRSLSNSRDDLQAPKRPLGAGRVRLVERTDPSTKTRYYATETERSDDRTATELWNGKQ